MFCNYDVVELLDTDYLLGHVWNGKNSRTVNYIFLWAKCYIYRQCLFHNGLLKVNHNACSLHLATHFQTQTSHMGMFYMVY